MDKIIIAGAILGVGIWLFLGNKNVTAINIIGIILGILGILIWTEKALHWASRDGHLQVVEFLVLKSVNIHASDG